MLENVPGQPPPPPLSYALDRITYKSFFLLFAMIQSIHKRIQLYSILKVNV